MHEYIKSLQSSIKLYYHIYIIYNFALSFLVHVVLVLVDRRKTHPHLSYADASGFMQEFTRPPRDAREFDCTVSVAAQRNAITRKIVHLPVYSVLSPGRGWITRLAACQTALAGSTSGWFASTCVGPMTAVLEKQVREALG